MRFHVPFYSSLFICGIALFLSCNNEIKSDLLVDALKDSDYEVRFEAAQSLKALGWEPSTSQEEADLLVALRKWEDVVELGEYGMKSLLNVFDTDLYIQPWMPEKLALFGETLLRIEGKDSLPVLTSSLLSDDKETRLWVARTLRNMNTDESKAVLKEHILSESDREVKAAINLAL